MQTPILIACDFDGTVTQDDTLVRILDQYGSRQWREVQDQVVDGSLSIREGLRQEMGSVQADVPTIKTLLETEIRLDPDFPGFLNTMRARGIPVVLLSGGFGFCIETVMQAHGLWPIPYLANDLSFENNRWEVAYPFPVVDCEACGHCKADSITMWENQGLTTIFVGNGVTDRCGAKAATVTYAKDELWTWCQTQAVEATSFTTFADIAKDLEARSYL